MAPSKLHSSLTGFRLKCTKPLGPRLESLLCSDIAPGWTKGVGLWVEPQGRGGGWNEEEKRERGEEGKQ